LGEITVMPVGTFAGHAVVLIHGDNVDFVQDMTTGQFTNHLLEIHPEPVFIGCLDLSGRRGQDKR
jgi:hypothetical protein